MQTNREKIIVVFALLALAYGAYEVFFHSPPKAPTFQSSSKGKSLDTLNSFITKVAEAAQEGLSDTDNYIIQRAEAQWIQDPLIRIRKPLKVETEPEDVVTTEVPEMEIAYTGYIEMGSMRLAIINGNEYASGDRLEQGDYIVRSISATQVVLITTDRNKNRFIVPLQELQ
jgi:hypothetical protein